MFQLLKLVSFDGAKSGHQTKLEISCFTKDECGGACPWYIAGCATLHVTQNCGPVGFCLHANLHPKMLLTLTEMQAASLTRHLLPFDCSECKEQA